MKKVAIVTDTTVSIPRELARKYGIQVVPLLLHLDGSTYKDIIEIKTADELFQLVEKSSNFPTTSAPPPGEYAKVYRQLAKKVNNILTITISSNLSMTFGSATQAIEMVKSELPDINIEVFDSKTTVGAMGLIALAAAQAAASGQDMAGVVSVAEDIRSKVNYLFVMDTLSYLARSGRINKATAMVGNILSMKPITEISTASGRPTVVTKPRTRKKALQVLSGLIRERVKADGPLHILVDHTGLPEEAAKLKEMVLEQFDCAEVLLCEYNPISSLIVGPGGVGLGFYQG